MREPARRLRARARPGYAVRAEAPSHGRDCHAAALANPTGARVPCVAPRHRTFRALLGRAVGKPRTDAPVPQASTECQRGIPTRAHRQAGRRARWCENSHGDRRADHPDAPRRVAHLAPAMRAQSIQRIKLLNMPARSTADITECVADCSGFLEAEELAAMLKPLGHGLGVTRVRMRPWRRARSPPVLSFVRSHQWRAARLAEALPAARARRTRRGALRTRRSLRRPFEARVRAAAHPHPC